MTPHITYTLNAARKFLLAAVATATIVAPILIGSTLATTYRAGAQTDVPNNASFQSVSIQESQPGGVNLTILVGPDSFRSSNYSLRELIAWAFDMQSALVSGPDILDAKYDVDAVAPAAVTASGYLTMDAARSMVRNMLADQFRLQVHRGTQSVSAYVLTRSGSGTHFQVARPAEPGPIVRVGPTSISGSVLRTKDIVDLLSQRLGHPVLDQTGLIQTYDFKLDWKADSSQAAPEGAVPAVPPTASPELMASALQTQLGMTIRLEQIPAQVLVVDHVQAPKDLVAAPKAVPMDPKLFDSYVGHYALLGGIVMTVSRDSEHLWTQLPGQPPVEIFSEGQGKFFAKAVNAQISFLTDAQGQVSGLELHQNGRNIPGPRMDEVTAKQMADTLDKKVQQQAATLGSEQALRQFIPGLASGKPDYDRMNAGLADATRQQLSVLQPWFASLGSLMSLKFASVDPQGADTYVAQFEHGAVECHIVMAPDGKIASAFVRPLPEGETLATVEHKEVAVNPRLFDGYVGSYQLAPNFILTVTREGTHLFAQLTGQTKAEIFPEGERDYFYKVVDAQITFVTDNAGRATELILHQNGLDQHAKRFEGVVPPVKEHKEINVDPKLFDGYAGSYQLAPNFISTVTREGDHLFVQATGQPKVEVFPEGDHDYFYKVVDAQLTFVTDSQGKATELILHQGGDHPAKRVE